METGKEAEGTVPTEPTAEEKVTSLTQQLEAKSLEAETATKSVQGLRGSLLEKDRLLRDQSNSDSRISNLEDSINILSYAVSKGSQSEDGLEPKGDDLKKHIDDLKREREAKQAESKRGVEQAEYYAVGNAIRARAVIALKDDEDALEKVENSILVGNFERAESRVAKAEKKETKVETESEIKERYEREFLIKHGLAKTETAQASSAGKRIYTRAEARDLANNSTPEQWAKIKPEMDSAEEEGRVRE